MNYIKYTWGEIVNSITLENGIYCGFYNSEPAVIRIKDNEPVFVQFIDRSAIYDKRGITLSNVEILINL